MTLSKNTKWLMFTTSLTFVPLANISPVSASVSVGIAPTVIINEVLATNYSGATDETGKQEDWVELYNTTSATVDLSGWGLSNAAKNPFRWVFPAGTTINAKSYLRVWMSKNDRIASTSNLHTNFNVDNGVDSVVLTAPDLSTLGVTVDSVTPPFSKPDVSWCRVSNGNSNSVFAFCLTPTPKAANSGVTALALLPSPVLSHVQGIYPSALAVTATGPEGAELRYTLDGNEPVATSTLVNGNISIAQSAVLRVAAFKAGNVPSYAETATYVIDNSGRFNGQRQFFVTMKPSEASSFKAGGSAPKAGWKAFIEMVDENGTIAFRGNALTEQAGQLGSRNGQKTLPMDIKFSDAVGTKNVKYQIFHTKPTVSTFKKLRLRNAGDDYQEAHIRDQFFQSLGDQANLAPSAVEPAQMFINGTYYGMMDLREKEDETLVESTYGVDKDTVDFLSDSKVLNGDAATANFNTAYNYITGNNMAVPANYEKAKTILDLENFAHDFAIHMFAADGDWQWRNMHYFRMPTYDGKWRYRLHDFDISGDGINAWGFDTRAVNDMNRMYCCYKSGNMMRALLANPQFKALYVNVIADQLNSVLSYSETSKRLTDMSTPMAAYLPAHIAANNQPPSMASWQGHIERLRTFLADREQYYDQHTRSYLGLGYRKIVQLSVSDTNMGNIKVNTLDLTQRLTMDAPIWVGKYYPDFPITVEARPKPGYAFVRWEGNNTSNNQVISPSIATDGMIYNAVFEPISTVPAPTVAAVANQTNLTGNMVLLQIQATDPGRLALNYTASKLPAGLDIHPITGMISGKLNRAGTYTSTITVSNGKTSTKTNISWTITNKGDRLVSLPIGVVGDGTGLNASYFNNATLSGTPNLTRVELPAINIGGGAGPVTGFPTSNWAIRWEGKIEAPISGTYSLQSIIRNDDGVRVWIAGNLVVDNWGGAATTSAVDVSLAAGSLTPIKVEFWDKSGAAALALNSKIPGTAVYQPMPLAVFNP